MISELVVQKRKLSLKMKEVATDYTGMYYDEIKIWDEEFLKSYVNYNKELYDRLSKDNSDLKYTNKLIEIVEEIILLSSNSFENIDFCRRLSIANSNYLLEVIEGLSYYQSGQKEEAFLRLYGFYLKGNQHINHYLYNKVLGSLLFERGKLKEAQELLSIAIQKRPTDTETYILLRQVYQEQGEETELCIVNEIIKLLGEQ